MSGLTTKPIMMKLIEESAKLFKEELKRRGANPKDVEVRGESFAGGMAAMLHHCSGMGLIKVFNTETELHAHIKSLTTTEDGHHPDCNYYLDDGQNTCTCEEVRARLGM